jgi:hypothetical protein
MTAPAGASRADVFSDGIAHLATVALGIEHFDDPTATLVDVIAALERTRKCAAAQIEAGGAELELTAAQAEWLRSELICNRDTIGVAIRRKLNRGVVERMDRAAVPCRPAEAVADSDDAEEQRGPNDSDPLGGFSGR